MKIKRRHMILTAVFVAAILAYFLQDWPRRAMRKSVETTRQTLRQEGFRNDTPDFKFDTSAENLKRGEAITAPGLEISLELRAKADDFRLMRKMSKNSALPITPLEFYPAYGRPGTNMWVVVKQELRLSEKSYDQAIEKIMGGPIEFRFEMATNNEPTKSHLYSIKSFAVMSTFRAALAMHEHNTNSVITNIFAASHLAIEWHADPTEFSHLVRFACVLVAETAIWESMQTDYWDEQSLVALQRKWEAADFLKQVPETAEGECAALIARCRAQRNVEYDVDWKVAFREMARSPTAGSKNLSDKIEVQKKHAHYRDHDSYEDELTAMQFFAQRHRQLKRAILSPSWVEMRSLPGVTNTPIPELKSKNIVDGVRMKMSVLEGRSFMGRVAETEALRRIIVTAIALERFALHHKAYPEALQELVPEFLPAVTIDFMDGKEMHYRRRADGRYLLYSVGVNGVDDGGISDSFNFREPDLVWPLPATQADVDAYSKGRY